MPSGCGAVFEGEPTKADAGHTSNELFDTKPKRLRNTQNSRNNRDDVADVPQRTGQCFAEQRRQRRTDRQWQTTAVAKERNCQTGYRVTCPCAQTPVQVGPDICGADVVDIERRCQSLNDRGDIFEVCDRFRDRPCQHANTDTGAKHH